MGGECIRRRRKHRVRSKYAFVRDEMFSSSKSSETDTFLAVCFSAAEPNKETWGDEK